MKKLTTSSFSDGEILTKKQLKNIMGGDPVDLTPYFHDTCPPDTAQPPGCPCTSNSDCLFTGTPDPNWTPLEYQNQRGVCFDNICRGSI
jgi:hypothetical protein